MKRPFLTRLWVYGAAASAALAFNFMLNTGGPVDVDDLERKNVPVEQQVESLSGVFNAVSELHYTRPSVESLEEAARECAPEQETIAGTLDCVLQSLDPHSRYIAPVQHQQDLEEESGQRSYSGIGVGIALDQESGYVKVTDVFDGGPAKGAGLQTGDLITHVDGESAHGFTLQQIREAIIGETGTSVVVTIARDGQSQDFIIDRANVTVDNSPVTAKQIGNNIGYVHLRSFGQHNAGEEVREAVEQLREQMGDDFEGLVLDLRYNPGGFAKEAGEIADDFLNSGQIINFGRTPDGEDNHRTFAAPGDILDGLPIVVLVNERSASASELLSGALQDHGRATIMGTRSYGKGSAQNEFMLSNGGVLHITTMLYFLPDNGSVQNIGIIPDIEVLTGNDNERRVGESVSNGALTNPNGQTEIADSPQTCDMHQDVSADDVGEEFRTRNGGVDEALLCAVEYLSGGADHVTIEDKVEAQPQQKRALKP